MEQETVTKLGSSYCSPFAPLEAQLLPFLKNLASLRNLFFLQLGILKEFLTELTKILIKSVLYFFVLHLVHTLLYLKKIKQFKYLFLFCFIHADNSFSLEMLYIFPLSQWN